MTITSGDILRVVTTLLWTDGNIMQNVFNAVVTGVGSPWDDDDIVDDAVDWADTMYANHVADMSQACDGSQVQVYVYDPIDDDWDEVGSGNWSFNPTGPVDQSPRGAAVLLNLKTTDPDVSGKKYLGGMKIGATVDGLYTAAIIANAILFGADWAGIFVGATSAADWTPGVWSVADTVFKAAGDTLITSFIPAYQRRRKRGVGV